MVSHLLFRSHLTQYVAKPPKRILSQHFHGISNVHNTGEASINVEFTLCARNMVCVHLCLFWFSFTNQFYLLYISKLFNLEVSRYIVFFNFIFWNVYLFFNIALLTFFLLTSLGTKSRITKFRDLFSKLILFSKLVRAENGIYSK